MCAIRRAALQDISRQAQAWNDRAHSTTLESELRFFPNVPVVLQPDVTQVRPQRQDLFLHEMRRNVTLVRLVGSLGEGVLELSRFLN